jgi:hypothetical protein
MPDTSQCLSRLAGGEGQALGELFEHCRPRLRQMVQLWLDPRVVACLDPSDVLDVSNSGITGSETGITVSSAPATHFVLSGPASIAARTPFNLPVTAVDSSGNTARGYAGLVHFSDSVGWATLPGNYIFQASDQGVHTFNKLKLKTKGVQTITVMDTLNNSILGTWTIDVT